MKLIDRRRENSINNVNGKCSKDLLGLMIQASDSSPHSSITVNDIVEECKSFFFAGNQTTSNLLTWTTVLLAMHPQWQLQARAEVLRVCGSRDIPTKDDVVKLKTVSYVRTKIMFCLFSPFLFPPRNKNQTATFCSFFFFFLLTCALRATKGILVDHNL